MAKLFFLCLLVYTPQTKWLVYTNPANKFTINYPENWATKYNTNTFIFLSPLEGANDLFQENVNLMIQDLSQQPMNLEQYTELSKKQITDNFGASAIISLKNIILGGQPAKEFICLMNIQGKKLKLKQYWFVKEKKAFLFSYTAEPAQFSKYESIATETINSFRFL